MSINHQKYPYLDEGYSINDFDSVKEVDREILFLKTMRPSKHTPKSLLSPAHRRLAESLDTRIEQLEDIKNQFKLLHLIDPNTPSE